MGAERIGCPRGAGKLGAEVTLAQAMPTPVDTVPRGLNTGCRARSSNRVYQQYQAQQWDKPGPGTPVMSSRGKVQRQGRRQGHIMGQGVHPGDGARGRTEHRHSFDTAQAVLTAMA